MKIRTLEELTDKLDRELSWRRKELSNLKFLVSTSSNTAQKQSLVRCSIALIYAHWEGFVKESARYFLAYIATQKLKNQELSLNLLTLSFKHSVNFSVDSKKYSAFGVITSFFVNELDKRSQIPYQSGIDTASNLSSEILKEISWCLGIDYGLFETREKFIDEKLLSRRNHIAHGGYLEIDVSEFDELRDGVLALMVLFKNQIENIAVQKLYLKSRSSTFLR